MSDADFPIHPAGLTCSDCFAFGFCRKLFACKPTNTTCDWSPSRFQVHPARLEQLVTAEKAATAVAR